MNTCIICLDTVTADEAGVLRVVGEPFATSIAHAHRVALSLAA